MTSGSGGTVAAVVAAIAAVAALAMAGCGGDSDSGGATKLTWFIFNEPSAAPQKIAERCSKQSGGRYDISFELLPNQADQQREQLVRRLGAEDSTMDLLGMDVVWTGEFANAGWLAPVPPDVAKIVSDEVFDSVLETARFKNRLYTVPIWSNTQLLWYRKDRVPDPPKTWDEMIDQAEKLGPSKGRFQLQANRYEGLVVLANQLIESAGSSILSGPTTAKLDRAPTERALRILGRLSQSKAAAANLTTSTEDTARLGFEGPEPPGESDTSFMINYPFVYPSAKTNRPKNVFPEIGVAKYPQVDPGRPSAPPIGGINIGVSAYSKHPEEAFAAAQCLVKPENQLEVATLGGLPLRSDLYDRPEIEKIYPGFADILRASIEDAAPRPSISPAYQDLSLAVQRALHPTTKIDPKNVAAAYDELRAKVEQAIKREGLL
jgi:multiple sugar transport system substrate-binding protein